MTDERRSKLAEDIAEKAQALASILPEGLSLRVERGRVTSRVTLRESEPELRVMPALKPQAAPAETVGA